MTPPVKTENSARPRAVARLQRAFAPKRHPDWKEARAAILAGAPVDTLIPAWSGATPLIIAATLAGCTTEVKWLLDHGAALEAVNPNGVTALVRAAANSRAATVALLLARGADPNTRDRNGWTVLMMVGLVFTTESAKGLIATLLDHGADPSATAPDGRTAPKIFMANGKPELTEYLDEVLASNQHAAARRRLLDRLTADQRAAWLPRACAAEAAAATRTAWCRTP